MNKCVFYGVLTALAIFIAYAVGRRLARGPDRFTIAQTRGVISRVDGLPYRVHESHSGPQRAADTLAAVNGRILTLLRYLRREYVRGGAGQPPARRDVAARLLARYNPDSLAENSPNDPSGDTSYTIDKGAVIALCLRDREAQEIHDLDTLTFVALHEMTHIAIKDADHPPRFWEAFRFILEAAEAAGVLVSADYAAAPRAYCGVKIDFNPRYDTATASL